MQMCRRQSHCDGMKPLKNLDKPTTSDEKEIHLNARAKNCLFESFIMDIFNQVLTRTKANEIWLKLHDTTPDLHITADIITAGFVRTGSDVLSLPVMSLKMRK